LSLSERDIDTTAQRPVAPALPPEVRPSTLAAAAPEVIPAKRYGMASLASAGVVIAVLAGVAWVALTNKDIGWSIFAAYFFSKPILMGVGMTLLLTFVSMVMATVLGTLIAIMRMTSNPILQFTALAYSWLLRGIPVLVQLMFWYNIALLFPRIALTLPGLPPLFSVTTNAIVTPFVAASLGLGLSMSAYIAEVVRGGILSVGSGQVEAIRSLGMTQAQGLRRVILPQAMRVVLPPLGNELIGLLKWTSLASVIAVSEVMHEASLIFARTFEVIPLLLVAAAWYLLITTLFSIGQQRLERHFGRSERR
jgi:polar amino acid transport system permease protein